MSTTTRPSATRAIIRASTSILRDTKPMYSGSDRRALNILKEYGY